MQLVSSMIPAELKRAPNAKMFLRSFWFRATARGVAPADGMHIYTLAAFLLELSLIELPCSAHPHSMLAASALSLALAFFGKESWPGQLSAFGSYTLEDLQPCRQRMAAAQVSQDAFNLRYLWRSAYKEHDYPHYDADWRKAHAVMAQPSDAIQSLLEAPLVEAAMPCVPPLPLPEPVSVIHYAGDRAVPPVGIMVG